MRPRPAFAPAPPAVRPWRVTRLRATADRVLPVDELDELVACQTAADLADRPGEVPCARAELLAQLAPPFRGSRFVHLAHDRSGRLLGYARLGIYSAFHRELAHAGLTVHPAARRNGVGSALLAELAGAASANGRSRLVLDGPRNAATEAFARSGGLAVSSCDLRSRLSLAEQGLAERLAAVIPQQRMRRLLALRWAGPCPEYLLDSLTRTLDCLHADPADASVTPFTGAEVRHRERAAHRAGLREYTACLLDAETGRIAALSTAHTADGVRGEQNETVVVPEFRGHGLAIRVKAYLVRELLRAEPGMRVLETYNAVGNTRMLAVNRRLGFVPVDTHAAWTLPLL